MKRRPLGGSRRQTSILINLEELPEEIKRALNHYGYFPTAISEIMKWYELLEKRDISRVR